MLTAHKSFSVLLQNFLLFNLLINFSVFFFFFYILCVHFRNKSFVDINVRLNFSSFLHVFMYIIRPALLARRLSTCSVYQSFHYCRSLLKRCFFLFVVRSSLSPIRIPLEFAAAYFSTAFASSIVYLGEIKCKNW